MRLGGPFIAPRDQGAVWSSFRRPWLPFGPWVHRTVWCTPDNEQCVISFHTSHADRWVSCWILRSSGTPDSPVWPVDRWPGTHGSRWLHVDYWLPGPPASPVNYSQSAWPISREWLVRPLSNLAHRTLFGAHRTVRCYSGWPNFGQTSFSPILLDLRSFLALRWT
jgi:hypothetical protein